MSKETFQDKVEKLIQKADKLGLRLEVATMYTWESGIDEKTMQYVKAPRFRQDATIYSKEAT